MNGMTGFNPLQVQSAVDRVMSSYNDLSQAVINETQQKFVTPMGQQWACTEAQQWFEQFKTTINSIETQITNVFESVISSMNSAGAAWAQRTGGTSFVQKSFSPFGTQVNTEAIQENINGVRGIDKAQATETVKTLKVVAQHASDALAAAKQAVSSSGFIGGDQEATLIASLEKIKTNIDSTLEQLSTSATTAIQNTVTSYGDQEGKISSSFAGGE